MQLKTITSLMLMAALAALAAMASPIVGEVHIDTSDRPPYQVPTGHRAEHSDLIVVAKVERLKYFKWPNPKGYFYRLPSTSDTPVKGYDEYIHLANVKVLWDKYEDVPAEFNFMKTGRPLWSHSDKCIQNDSWPWPLASSMLGETRIFFLKPAISASENTQLVTTCHHGSAPLEDLPLVKEIVSKRKASVAATQRK